MSVEVDLQIITVDTDSLPTESQIQEWAEAASLYKGEVEVCVRIVDEAESQQLNAEYRGKDKPTNVLSFPFEAPEHVPLNLLGDLVLCSQVIQRESLAQKKLIEAHWAHMVVHGMLHLQGYDHIDDADADVMEALEIHILEALGYANPYQEQTD